MNKEIKVTKIKTNCLIIYRFVLHTFIRQCLDYCNSIYLGISGHEKIGTCTSHLSYLTDTVVLSNPNSNITIFYNVSLHRFIVH